jgi:hypothetical protein
MDYFSSIIPYRKINLFIVLCMPQVLSQQTASLEVHSRQLFPYLAFTVRPYLYILLLSCLWVLLVYDKLGYQWATTLLALLSLVMAPFP